MQWVCLMVFCGCLLFACVTDLLCCQVYNFTWWIALLSQAWPMWEWAKAHAGAASEGRVILVELSLFCLIQILVAGRIYGKADAYAFCACALSGAGIGMGMVWYLMQMLLAYLLLFLVQAARRNIARNGNLNRPVPFLPYITVSFGGTIILYALKWGT